MREPDWDALSDLQFLLYNRIADSLNASLSAIALSDMPEAADKPPGFWKERASTKVANVLNLFTAWSNLIRFKRGEVIPDQELRPFRANVLLAWLAAQLQLSTTPRVRDDLMLQANQETLQEALLLLYSAAFTQGSSVRLELEPQDLGMWFRVGFIPPRPLPPTLDELLASFGDHWRAQDTYFELNTARDFIRLNGSELVLKHAGKHAEFAFFVRAAGVSKEKVADQLGGKEKPGEGPASARQRVIAMDSSQITLIIPEDDLPAPGEDALPPSLAVLRPLPAPRMPQPDTAPVASRPEGAPVPGTPPPPTGATVTVEDRVSTPIVLPAPGAAEGRATPGEPAETAKPTGSDEPDEAATSPEPTIVGLKIPPPTAPTTLRTPPASTSNVALTKDTQSMRPVRPGDTADEAPDSAPHEPVPPAPAPDSPEGTS